MIKKIALAAVVAAASAASANAAVLYASQVVSTNPTQTVAADRSNAAAALGAADDKFYSVGLGGSIVLGFSKLVSGEGTISEVTFSRPGYFESANVRFSVDGKTWSDYVKTVANDTGVSTIDGYDSPFQFIEIVDTSAKGKGRDGFDIDAVSFNEYTPAPVPLPAAGLLLLGGLAGMGGLALRRKKA